MRVRSSGASMAAMYSLTNPILTLTTLSILPVSFSRLYFMSLEVMGLPSPNLMSSRSEKTMVFPPSSRDHFVQRSHSTLPSPPGWFSNVMYIFASPCPVGVECCVMSQWGKERAPAYCTRDPPLWGTPPTGVAVGVATAVGVGTATGADVGVGVGFSAPPQARAISRRGSTTAAHGNSHRRCLAGFFMVSLQYGDTNELLGAGAWQGGRVK